MNQQKIILEQAAQYIAKLTADNDHCGALVVVADLVGIARHKNDRPRNHADPRCRRLC